jgi:transposase-like protein
MRPAKSKYTPLPTVPAALMPRLVAVVEVLTGIKTVSAAARELGLSRNHFQSLMHRGLLALVQAITAHPGGRPARSPELARLQAELKRLQRENARLKNQVGSTERLLTVASGLLQGRIRATGRQRRLRSSAGSRRDGGEESDPDASRCVLLAGADAMRQLNLAAPLVAAIAGVGASTLRRWRVRRRRGQALLAQPRPVRHCARLGGDVRAAAEHIVRRLHGLIGAESLARSVGTSRRVAARVKQLTLTRMERERKAGLRQIRIAVPGVLRGMDAMQFPGSRDRYALIAADGAVPYRTSITLGRCYDATLVARALESDLQQNGVPLVYRLDRASAHDAPAARAVLAAHRVLVLHGPPRYPCYYGQLERQNREHRAWLRAEPGPDDAALEPCLREMLEAVNRLWRRRTLGWRTAAEAWSARPPLAVDRDALHQEVQDRAHVIARRLSGRGQPADLAERLAIEQTLTRMGYMRQEIGGWC